MSCNPIAEIYVSQKMHFQMPKGNYYIVLIATLLITKVLLKAQKFW